METNKNIIGEDTKVKSLKNWFALPGIIAGCKSLRTVTLLVGGLVMVVFLTGAVFGKEDIRTQLKNAYMELGAISYGQKELESKAADIRKNQIEPLQIKHNDFAARRVQIEAKIVELESTFTQLKATE